MGGVKNMYQKKVLIRRMVMCLTKRELKSEPTTSSMCLFSRMESGQRVRNKQSKYQKGRIIKGKQNWEKNIRTKAVTTGASRTTSSGKIIEEKWMGPPGCAPGCRYDCKSFSDEHRLTLFTSYWSLNTRMI